jgi:hypothetical protein
MNSGHNLLELSISRHDPKAAILIPALSSARVGFRGLRNGHRIKAAVEASADKFFGSEHALETP